MHEQARKAISYCSWFKGKTNRPPALPSRRVQECNTLTKPEFVMAQGGVRSEKGTSDLRNATRLASAGAWGSALDIFARSGTEQAFCYWPGPGLALDVCF